MKLFKGPGAIKTGLFLLVAFVVFFALGVKPVKAFQNKKSDTAVSTSDVQFTDIPTAADSAKEFQKKQAELKKKQATITTAQPAAEKSQTLWEIFIAGFVGGLLAITMPCIYPLLPLTVSFFTKKTGFLQIRFLI